MSPSCDASSRPTRRSRSTTCSRRDREILPLASLSDFGGPGATGVIDAGLVVDGTWSAPVAELDVELADLVFTDPGIAATPPDEMHQIAEGGIPWPRAVMIGHSRHQICPHGGDAVFERD